MESKGTKLQNTVIVLQLACRYVNSKDLHCALNSGDQQRRSQQCGVTDGHHTSFVLRDFRPPLMPVLLLDVSLIFHRMETKQDNLLLMTLY